MNVPVYLMHAGPAEWMRLRGDIVIILATDTKYGVHVPTLTIARPSLRNGAPYVCRGPVLLP